MAGRGEDSQIFPEEAFRNTSSFVFWPFLDVNGLAGAHNDSFEGRGRKYTLIKLLSRQYGVLEAVRFGRRRHPTMILFRV